MAIYEDKTFPEFNLARLLKTVFRPKGGEKVAILIDFEDPKVIEGFSFLDKPEHKDSPQFFAYEKIYKGLREGALDELGMVGGDVFAFEETGGSNLDLPDRAITVSGEEISLEKDVYPNYDIIMAVTKFSATAPLTAFCKKYGFRGSTMHGLNQVIIDSGLAVDYNEVSKEAEKLRVGMSGADAVEIDYEVAGKKLTLRLELGGQDAQKSHGLCNDEPDIANLPAGEVYFVPTGAEGKFPLKYEDGTIAIMDISGMRIQGGELLSGNPETLEEHLSVIKSDPAAGDIGELGFGTQELPVSGSDIQDEKIFGTLHVATGRSDHLGGDITPDKFEDAKNATHEDILFSPSKTPEINVPQARLFRAGETHVLIENFQPKEFLLNLRAG